MFDYDNYDSNYDISSLLLLYRLLESLKTNMSSSSADTAISAMEMIKKLCEGK